MPEEEPAGDDKSVEEIAKRVRDGVEEWREGLLTDPLVVELVRQSDEEKMQETESKFTPVHDAVRSLLHSLEKASVPASLVTEMEDVLSTMVALSVRAASSDPSALADCLFGINDPANQQPNAGLSIRSTALGRRASASYRVFDRMGGWEILSACVDGVYMRVIRDPRIGMVQLEAEQTLKTTLLEFLSAAFSGIHGRAASCCQWKKLQETVLALGLEPSYFDFLIEHFQITLDELGVPHEEAEAAITALKTSKPLMDDISLLAERGSGSARLSLLGRQSLGHQSLTRQSAAEKAEQHARRSTPGTGPPAV